MERERKIVADQRDLVLGRGLAQHRVGGGAVRTLHVLKFDDGDLRSRGRLEAAGSCTGVVGAAPNCAWPATVSKKAAARPKRPARRRREPAGRESETETDMLIGRLPKRIVTGKDAGPRWPGTRKLGMAAAGYRPADYGVRGASVYCRVAFIISTRLSTMAFSAQPRTKAWPTAPGDPNRHRRGYSRRDRWTG